MGAGLPPAESALLRLGSCPGTSDVNPGAEDLQLGTA
jgi:hypothetical protein